MIFHVVKGYFTSVGDISRRQANSREISDIFHFTAIHFLPERHSAMVLIYIYIYWHNTMCVSAGRGKEDEHLASRLNLYNIFFVFDLHS